MPIVHVKMRTAVTKFFDEDPGMLGGAASTRRSYRRSLEVLLKHCPTQMGAYQLKAEHIELALKELREGATPEENALRFKVGESPRKGRGEAALGNDVKAFKAFIRFLHRREYLSGDRHPAAHLKSNPPTSAKVRVPISKMVVQPSEEVFTRLLEAAGDRHPRDRVVIAIGVYAGFRESEIRVLKFEDIDFDSDLIQVYRPKQKGYHTVPIHPVLRAELLRYFAWLGTFEPNLDPTWHVVGQRLTKFGQLTQTTRLDLRKAPLQLAKDVKAAFAAAGYPELYRLGVHTMRKMAGIHLHNLTKNPRVAQRLYGHQKGATTDLYLQHGDDLGELRAAMRALRPVAGGNISPVQISTARKGRKLQPVAA